MLQVVEIKRENRQREKAVAITADRATAAGVFLFLNSALLLTLLLLGAGRLIGP